MTTILVRSPRYPSDPFLQRAEKSAENAAASEKAAAESQKASQQSASDSSQSNHLSHEARLKAETAQRKAETAQDAAEVAQRAAESAQGKAEASEQTAAKHSEHSESQENLSAQHNASSESHAIRAEAAADRADAISGIDNVQQALSLAAVPTPNIHVPLVSSLVMEGGKGSPIQIDISEAQDGSKKIDLPFQTIGYICSTKSTYVGTDGKPIEADIDEPRFEKEGLLCEQGSTNLITQSNGLGWGTFAGSVIATESQGGVMGLDCARGTFPVVGYNSWFRTSNLDVTGDAVASGYLKYISGSPLVRINFWTGTTDAHITFNMQTLEFSEASPDISLYRARRANDGWVWVTVTCRGCTGDNAQSFSLRNHINFENSFLFDAWQLEARTYCTSYIPTNGEPATRAQSITSMSSSNLPNGRYSLSIAATISSENGGWAFAQNYDNSGSAFREIYVSLSGVVSFRNYNGIGIETSEKFFNGTVVGVSNMEEMINKIYCKGNMSSRVIETDLPFDRKQGSITIGGYPWRENRSLSGHIKDLKIWFFPLTDEQASSL